MYVAKKSSYNPILIPNRDHYWEEFATFNMCPIKKGKITYGLYRAMSAVDKLNPQHQVSIIGVGESLNGIHFENRRPFITPEAEWDKNGCEDPRITFFEGKYYTFYTALSNYPFSAEGIKVGVAISKNFKKIEERHLVTPFNAKAMALFPERINGKIVVIFSINTDRPPSLSQICLAYLDKIEDLWNEEYWREWMKNIDDHVVNFKRTKYDQLEVGAPPVKTRNGWLLVYSHIQNYFPSPEKLDKVFGVEAVLLDHKNLKKIVGRTGGPILAPSESYELGGYVNDVIFPTGALVNKDILTIYYGAADTTTCIAHVNLPDLISTMRLELSEGGGLHRFSGNPVISPINDHHWENKATFNPAAIFLNNKIHLLYRAFSDDNTSSLGYASSRDGFHINERLSEPVYVPREDFEMKKISNGNSGCEDPRITKIGKEIYICYTAYDSVNPPRVAISSIKQKDFLAKKWNWSKPILITPAGVDDKDACILPTKFKDGYFILHRLDNEVCGDYIKSLHFKNEMVDRCIRIFAPRINSWDSAKVGITAPPIKTKYGWLLLYHGVSKSHNTYRVGAILLNLKDPTIVISRLTDPIFAPYEDYEKNGVVDNVVFPCGMVVKNKNLYVYYGGGDKVIGVARAKLGNILKALLNGKKFNEK